MKQAMLPNAPSFFSRRLAIFALVVVSGFVLASVFHIFAEHLYGQKWPWSTFQFGPWDRFNDLQLSVRKILHRNPYYEESLGVAAYFPFSYLALGLFRGVSPLEIPVWFFFLCAALSVACCLYYLHSVRDLVRSKWEAFALFLGLFALSYPVLFGFDRGNLDLPLFSVCGIAILLWARKRPFLAGAVLALAIAMKGYPALFLLVFVLRRNYAAALFSVFVAFALTLASLASFSGGVVRNWEGFQNGLKVFEQGYVLFNDGRHYSCDPFNGLKIVKVLLGGETPRLDAWLARYSTLSTSFLMVSAASFAFGRLPMHRRYLILVLAMLVYPHISNDYKLVLLFIPLGAFAASRKSFSGRDVVLSIGMLLLLIPKQYYFLFADVSISCLISPSVILICWLTLLIDPKAWPSGWRAFTKRLQWYWRGLFLAWWRKA